MTPERLAAAFGAGANRRAGRARRARSTARFDPPTRTGSSKSIRSCAARPIRGSSRRRSPVRQAPSRRPPQQWFWERAVRSIGDHAALGGVGGARARIAGHARVAGAKDLGRRRRRSGAIDSRWCASRRACFANIDGDRAVDALVALGGYRRYRAVLLTLDRMDITHAARLCARRRSGAAARRRVVRPRREAMRSSRFSRRWRSSSAPG